MSDASDTSRRLCFRVKPQVRVAVARLNRSQNDIARECRLSSGYMSQLLTGTRNAGPEVRRRLMEVLSWDFDDLFEEILE